MTRFSCCIGTVGYEARSTFVPRIMAALDVDLNLAFFKGSRSLAFDAGKEYASQAGANIFDPVESSESDYRAWVRASINRAVGRSDAPVLVDVSSMTRGRIAATIEALEA